MNGYVYIIEVLPKSDEMLRRDIMVPFMNDIDRY
jgi:hypothetical protein